MNKPRRNNKTSLVKSQAVFLRALSYREKWKKRKEIISFVSYISYELNHIVGN